MSDANVRVKISADTSSIRREIQEIDRNLTGLGQNRVKLSSEPDKSVPRDGEKTTSEGIIRPSDKIAEQMQKTNTLLLRELVLIRKSLQKQTESQIPNVKRESPTTGTNNAPSNIPSSTPTPTPKTTPTILGKLAGAFLGYEAIKKGVNYANTSADASMDLERQSYKIYGSTLAYSDYYDPVRDTKGVATEFGFKVPEGLEASGANIATAGYRSREANKADLSAILGVSRLYGIDKSQLASASGRITAMGGATLGDQRRFTNMLAASIEEAGMKGRENEQLSVLEDIADILHEQLVTVKEQDIGNVVGFQTMLAKGNENLKGQNGISLIEKLNQNIRSNNPTVDMLMRVGAQGKFDGLEGMYKLYQAKEKGLADPENLKMIIRGYEALQPGGQGFGSTMSKIMLHNEFGLTTEQIEELIKHKDEILSGSYIFKYSDAQATADKALRERKQNYQQSNIGINDVYNINKGNIRASVGHRFNQLFKGWENFYNQQSEGTRAVIDLGWQGAQLLGMGGAAGAIYKGGSAILNGKLFDVMGNAEKLPFSFSQPKGYTAENLAKGLGTSVDDIVSSLGKQSVYSVDDVAKGLGTSVDDVVRTLGETTSAIPKTGGKLLGAIPKFGKALGVAGTVLSLGQGVSEYMEADTSKEKGNIIGSTLGGIGGGWAGASTGAALGSALGPIGTIIGGLIGGIGGGLIGDFTGGSLGELLGNSLEQSNYSEKIQTDEQTLNTNEDMANNTKALVELTDSIQKLDTVTKISSEFNYDQDETQKSSNEDLPWYYGARSHAVGEPFVPYDNYRAILHKGETVLSQYEAQKYREGKLNGTTDGEKVGTLDINVNLSGEIPGMTSQNQNQIVNAVIAKISSSNIQNMLGTSWTRVQNF